MLPRNVNALRYFYSAKYQIDFLNLKKKKDLLFSQERRSVVQCVTAFYLNGF